MVASGGSAVEPIVATAGAAESAAPATPAEPRPRPKPGILRLDISKPRRSSGGSVDFRCVSGPAGGASGGGNGGSSSATATGANSEVSEHDLVDTRECLRFVAGHVQRQ